MPGLLLMRVFCFLFLFLAFFVRASLPVSELHVHADAGILTESLFNKLAKRNHLKLRSADLFKAGIIYHKPGDFLDFLRVYDLASSVIVKPRDITEVIFDYLKRSSQHGAIYIELMISPEHFNKQTKVYHQLNNNRAFIREKSLSYQEVIDAVVKGIKQAKKKFGIEARILVVILRHNGVKAAGKLLNKIIAYPNSYVRGINLAGDDIHFPAKWFKKVYQKASQHGLKLSAHMGEHTTSKDIQLAMEMNLDRIGHGLSVIDDKAIMQKFKKSGIGIEVCPTSNIDGGYGKFKTMSTHPLKTMLKNHLFVSISTDDPSFLHTNIQEEYRRVQKAYHLSRKTMIELCRNAIKMSFAEMPLKKRLLNQIALNH